MVLYRIFPCVAVLLCAVVPTGITTPSVPVIWRVEVGVLVLMPTLSFASSQKSPAPVPSAVSETLIPVEA